MHKKLLLSAKLQNDTISLSATHINRRCGFLFGKVSPTSRPSFIGCPPKRESGRLEMGQTCTLSPRETLNMGKSIDIRESDHRIQRLSAKNVLANLSSV